jgi:acetyl esterase
MSARGNQVGSIAGVLAVWSLTGLGATQPAALADEPGAKAHHFSTFPASETTPLHPHFHGIGSARIEELLVRQAREAAAKVIGSLPKLNEPVAAVTDRTIPGPGGEIPLRIYQPRGPGPFPSVLYLHGGGWVLGSLDENDDVCRSLSHRAGAVVVSVGYRLAPEHRFPAAVEDCYAALEWLANHAAEVNADGHRIAVLGASAGGNLAAATALKARDRKGPRIALQVLWFPATNAAFDTTSYHLFAEGYGLSRDNMIYFWKSYLPRPEDADSPYASVLRARDVSGLPPALVQTAQYDVLRDEGEAYSARLHRAGVSVRCIRYQGMIHGFLVHAAAIDVARQALDDTAAALKKAFAQ